MPEILLILASLLASSGARVVPRPDGMLVEIRSDLPMTPEVTVSGYSVSIGTGDTISLAPDQRSLWLDSILLVEGGTILSVTGSDMVRTVDWALSSDSLLLVAFFSSGAAFDLPALAWVGPPEEPLRAPSSSSDSLAMSALYSGMPAPWLSDFDCIVLDPGHGGRDPGAVGPSGSSEKDRNLEIALLVRDLVSASMPSVRIVMTREDDRYVSLGDRTRMANRERADLFVSIHCNASTRREAGGFETYFLSLARTDEARAVAAMENGVAELYGEDRSDSTSSALSFLLADLAQNLYLSQSSGLAALVQQNLAREWDDGSDRGVKQAGFHVLRGAWMPSILVETAFISNPGEERLLQSLDFRFRAASAIVAGIEAFVLHQGSSQ